MCGILFGFDPCMNHSLIEYRSTEALQRIKHRGPNEGKILVHGDAVLGHRRLSIIDLKSSSQPMLSPDNRYSIAYNGEIYNYKSLRESLKAKWCFQTAGDTEVLFAGILTEGEIFLNKVQGMWAFFIWDSYAKQLFGARDRMGKKPFYYYENKKSLYIASELNAIKYLLGNERLNEDETSTIDYFKYGFYMPGKTAYKDIKELKPGHILNWEYQNQGHEKRYWNISLNNRGRSQDNDEKLRALLIQAVKDRLVADVKVGAFLSGGIDSSLITAIASQSIDDALETFTIKFSDNGYDESKFASKIAAMFKTNHHEKSIDKFAPDLAFELLNNHIGQPFGDSSILPTALVSQLAAEHVKVVLSGDGADELFSGYQRYTARSILRWYSRVPKQLRNVAVKAISKMPELQVHHSKSLLKKMQVFLKNYSGDGLNDPYVAPRMFTDFEIKELLPGYPGVDHKASQYEISVDMPDSISEMMYKDAMIYLPQDILQKVDRASMASGVEVRAPFLDSRIVEYAFSLTISSHRNILSGKQMIKRAFKDELPREIWSRRKQGFSVPVTSWFREGMGDLLLELLNGVHCQLNKDYILLLLTNNNKKISDEGFRLWTILSYLIWKNSKVI